MSDDDLGQRLHAALAPPAELRARPGAVARLRERGQAARRRQARTAAAAAAVAVLGLVAVPQLAGAPGAAPAAPGAAQPVPSPVEQPSRWPTDPATLGSPVEVRPVVAAWRAPTCPASDPRGPVVRHGGECLVLGQAVLIVRTVEGLSWSRRQSPRPQWEAYAGLVPADAAAIRRYAAGHRGGRIGFVVDGRPVPWALPANGADSGALHLVFVDRAEFTAFADAVMRGHGRVPGLPDGW